MPGFALVLFLLWRGSFREWKKWHLEGILVTALVAGPWYSVVTLVNGWEFVKVFFLENNLGRFTTDVYGHEQPFYFFAPVLLLMMLPWSFLLIPALRLRFARNEQLIMMWALAPFLFFSFSGSKLPAYILPMASPIALLCAREVARWEATPSYRIAVFLQAALWLALGVTFGFFGEAINVDIQVDGTLILILAAAIAAILIAIALWLPPPALGLFNVVCTAILVFVITGAVFPRAQSVESMRPWGEELNQFVSENQDVILYKPDRWMEYGLEFYRGRHIETALSEEQLAQLAPYGARTLCITQISLLDGLSTSQSLVIEVVHSIGDLAAFWVWRP